MTPRESSLWTWLEKGKPVGCLMQRIENSLNGDMPDVIGTYQRGAFMTELKVATANTQEMVKVKWSSPGQVAFIREWNGPLRTWILLQVPEYGRYLINGVYAKALMAPISIADLRGASSVPENAVAMQIISRMAGR